MFTLHPQLAADTLVVGDLPICRILLERQHGQFPWLIMVPKRTGCRDLTDLPDMDYLPVMEEIRTVHDALRALTGADRMDVAVCGGRISQLHIHVIARLKRDAVWPDPVFGTPATPYTEEDGAMMVEKLQKALDVTPVTD
jgi:diadenosine tetraphosphate (Ap4A) HIT family hydrolase